MPDLEVRSVHGPAGSRRVYTIAMNTSTSVRADAVGLAERRPRPIVALDVPSAAAALDVVANLPRADFFKVGLQLYTAAGPEIVRTLRDRGYSVFLDLKLHDIPNTVAGAVRAAADLGVDLLTVHASGGERMLASAAEAAAGGSLRLLGVTVLTSLTTAELGAAWGRAVDDASVEATRLATAARDAGLHGVVCSLQEAESIRSMAGRDLALLCPGIRLAGDGAGDQTRIGTPADAVRLGVDYVVIGRTVTAAADPAAAYRRVLSELGAGAGQEAVR